MAGDWTPYAILAGAGLFAALVLVRRARRIAWRHLPRRIAGNLRWTWSLNAGPLANSLLGIAGGVALFLVLAELFAGQKSMIADYMTFLLPGMIVIGSVLFLLAVLLDLITNFISGPQVEPGLETVQEQRIYDTGRIALEPQIDAALRDEDAGGHPAPQFED